VIDIPLSARVECADGPGGRSSYVIFAPETGRVTHFVVEQKRLRPTERLVPIDWVAETTHDLIHLHCTRDALATLEPFVEHHLVRWERPRYDQISHLSYPHIVPQETVVKEVAFKRIPKGELAVHRGAHVQATDGRVGQVDEFLVDQTDKHITHLVLREGRLWNQKDVTLPATAIERVGKDTVYLSLNKHAIESLPAVPLSGHHGWLDGCVLNLELIIKVFDEDGTAEQALHALQRLDKRGVITVRNAAVLVKDHHGEASFKEVEDLDTRYSALFGTIAGALIGLLGGPAGVLVGAGAGAVAGTVAAHKIHMGFPIEYLRELEQDLKPGNSAIVILVKNLWAEKAVKALAEFKGRLFQQALTDEVVSHLIATANTNPALEPANELSAPRNEQQASPDLSFAIRHE